MPFNDLEQIYDLFMDLDDVPRSTTIAIAYLDAFKNTWTTESMLEANNTKALKFYKEMSDKFYHKIRVQPSRRR